MRLLLLHLPLLLLVHRCSSWRLTCGCEQDSSRGSRGTGSAMGASQDVCQHTCKDREVGSSSVRRLTGKQQHSAAVLQCCVTCQAGIAWQQPSADCGVVVVHLGLDKHLVCSSGFARKQCVVPAAVSCCAHVGARRPPAADAACGCNRHSHHPAAAGSQCLLSRSRTTAACW